MHVGKWRWWREGGNTEEVLHSRHADVPRSHSAVNTESPVPQFDSTAATQTPHHVNPEEGDQITGTGGQMGYKIPSCTYIVFSRILQFGFALYGFHL